MKKRAAEVGGILGAWNQKMYQAMEIRWRVAPYAAWISIELEYISRRLVPQVNSHLECRANPDIQVFDSSDHNLAKAAVGQDYAK